MGVVRMDEDNNESRYERSTDKHLGYSPCFSCPSSDALAIYPNHAWCYSCENRFTYSPSRPRPTKFVKNNNSGGYRRMQGLAGEAINLKEPTKGQAPVTLTDRRLSKETLELYKVTVDFDESGAVSRHHYPYEDSDGNHVASKIRFCDKKGFICSGDMSKAGLFGKHTLKPGGKFITLFEGELDAMSMFEMTGYPGVSVKSAGSALRDVKEDYDYVNSFETIVLCFDRDEVKVDEKGNTHCPGQEATAKVAKLFKAGKVRIVDLAPYKDANDFLKAGKRKEFEAAWWKAQVFQLDGIVAGSSLFDEITKEDTYTLVSYPFDGMNEKLYGMRTSEMITITAGTGVGKTTLVKKLATHIADNTPPETKIGLLMLEETKKETVLGLMSAHSGIPFHLPDATYTQEQRDQSFLETMSSGKFFLHDHFGSTSIDNIMDKIDKLITQYDCKYIILDHISIVVSDQQSGDERRALDEIATKLKTLTISKDVCLIVVCHLKRIDGKPAEEGGRISLSDIRGTAGIGQLSNVVLGLERDVQGEEAPANQVKIRVLKDRFAGRTGVACELEFDYKTFSFSEIIPSDETATNEKFKG